jgi:hypothetical protein
LGGSPPQINKTPLYFYFTLHSIYQHIYDALELRGKPNSSTTHYLGVNFSSNEVRTGGLGAGPHEIERKRRKRLRRTPEIHVLRPLVRRSLFRLRPPARHVSHFYEDRGSICLT